MIKNDAWIIDQGETMITPFVAVQVTDGISYGVSSFGYDLRVADEFKVFSPISDGESSPYVDPKNMAKGSFIDIKADVCIIPPNSFALARSVEHIRMPRNILGVCLGKSTYARCGIVTNVTPLEPGWEGYVTLEIANTSPLPARIYANEGLVQVLFFEGEQPLNSYANRGGKYQGQQGITLPKI